MSSKKWWQIFPEGWISGTCVTISRRESDEYLICQRRSIKEANRGRSQGQSQMTWKKEAVQRGHEVTHLSRQKKGTVLIPGGSSCNLIAVMNKLLFQSPESFSNLRSITETEYEGPDGPSADVGAIKSFYQDKCLRKLPKKFNNEQILPLVGILQYLMQIKTGTFWK